MTDDREREIRAVLDLSPTRLVEHWDNYAELYEWADNERSRRIRAILDSAPPSPRVFFPGDTVPAGTFVLDRRGGVITGNGVVMPSTEPWLVQGETWTFVELQHPSPEEWLATVDRAHQARLAEATAQPHLSDPGTGEA